MTKLRTILFVAYRVLVAAACVVVLYAALFAYGCAKYGDNPPSGRYPWWMGG